MKPYLLAIPYFSIPLGLNPFFMQIEKGGDVKLDEVVITDEDLVPLSLFDDVVAEIDRKVRDRNDTIKKFIRGSQNDVKLK